MSGFVARGQIFVPHAEEDIRIKGADDPRMVHLTIAGSGMTEVAIYGSHTEILHYVGKIAEAVSAHLSEIADGDELEESA